VRDNGEHDDASAGSRWMNDSARVAFCYPAVLPYQVGSSGTGWACVG
jgi:hypothetical protein